MNWVFSFSCLKPNEFDIEMERDPLIYFLTKLGGVSVLQGLQLEEVAGYREGGSVRSEHMQYPDYAGEVPVEARYPVAVAAMSDDPNRSGRCA